jgi:hypothetical protein
MVTAARHRPHADASDPAALAAWLAEEIGAEMLVVAEAAPALIPGPFALRALAPDRPQDLTATG